MTTYADEIVTVLGNDATLLSILTGGVYNFSNLGRTGLNRIQTTDAFDKVTGLVKPVAVVLESDEIPDTHAQSSKFTPTIVPEMVWIYDNGDNGYATIAEAADRVYTLLHLSVIPNSFQVLWHDTLRDKREPLLKDSGFYRLTFYVHGYR